MKIYWTESAVGDLKGIKEYIARDSEYYAINFTDRIISSVEQLSSLPEMGRRITILVLAISLRSMPDHDVG
ncbi:MAG: type II toxin-antitoxin system RelE/ParE family toxin [Lentisphaerota bacterium]